MSDTVDPAHSQIPQAAPVESTSENSARVAPTPGKRAFFGRLGAAINTTRNVISNLLFFGLLIIALLLGLSTCQPVIVPDGSALLLNPEGVVVEQVSRSVGWQELVSGAQRVSEVAMQDLAGAINTAATDDAIAMLILDLDNLAYASPTQIARLGEHLNHFKAQNKKLVAVGNYYAQHQYYLASFADAVYMHPQGQVVLQGYGGNNFYIKDLLEKLDVSVHVFRAGEFKSAVEPLTRNEMSPEARLANEALYQDLWQQLVNKVAENRLLEPHAVQDFADRLPDFVGATHGDFARAALENHLVDELLTTDQARVRIASEVGYSAAGRDINAIDFMSYLAARTTQPLMPTEQGIGVLTVQGPIVLDSPDGAGANANQIVQLIQQARYNDAIRGLVVRVDSPGGSQFASEIIRQELELLQLTGKPVVASFGTAAASGGYWIAATADAIVSESATITGSIGIFSFITTFENALDRVGIHSDGVGTSSQTLSMDAFGGISADAARMIQARVDHGYDQFLNLVARGRNKPLDEVKGLAEGRVWSGAAALELGLVDALGGVDSALQKAASLADLDDWSVVPLAPPIDPRRELLRQVLGVEATSSTSFGGHPAGGFVQRLLQQARWLDLLEDPLQLYTVCTPCL